MYSSANLSYILAVETAVPSFDVLVIGSGASGSPRRSRLSLPAPASALATKGSLQANNSSKAQAASRPRSAPTTRRRQHAGDVWRSSHETADMRLVEVLTGDAQSAIHWLEGSGSSFTRDNGGYRLARCGGASAKRLLQVGDRTGHAITKGLREPGRPGQAPAI